MKKLIMILFVLVFAGTTAFAQNTADVNQTSSIGAEVYLTQTADASGASYADIDQTGGANFVSLEQTGLNDAVIDQDGKHSVKGFYDQWNSSDPLAIQTNTGGDINTMNITQESLFNQAYVNQVGSGNSMTVYQGGGNSNVARLLQESDDNILDVSLAGGSINRVLVEQTGAGSHQAYVDVLGSANNLNNVSSSYIYQDGMGHFADVNITGDANYYLIDQSGTGMTANHTVTGNNNSAVITQN